MKLSITRDQFEALSFQAKCGKLSDQRKDYVYNLVERNGEWCVDFGDGFEEPIEFERTIEDMLTEKGVMPKPEFGVWFCPNCYMDTGHHLDTLECRDCGCRN